MAMTATEAKAAVALARSSIILTAIDDAANRGETQVTIPFLLSTAQKTVVTGRGFILTEGPQSTTVSWA